MREDFKRYTIRRNCAQIKKNVYIRVLRWTTAQIWRMCRSNNNSLWINGKMGQFTNWKSPQQVVGFIYKHNLYIYVQTRFTTAAAAISDPPRIFSIGSRHNATNLTNWYMKKILKNNLFIYSKYSNIASLVVVDFIIRLFDAHIVW